MIQSFLTKLNSQRGEHVITFYLYNGLSLPRGNNLESFIFGSSPSAPKINHSSLSLRIRSVTLLSFNYSNIGVSHVYGFVNGTWNLRTSTCSAQCSSQEKKLPWKGVDVSNWFKADHINKAQWLFQFSELLSVLGIRIRNRIRRIRMFLGLLDPNPLVKGYGSGSGSFPFLINELK